MTTDKKIEIYTLDYCPYCMKAKLFFDKKGVKYTEIPCEDNEEEMRETLTKKFNLPNLATFPQIVIDDINIGGYSDLMGKVESGEIVF